ncbi:MAG: hypothetical protein CMA84_06260, partial [Euryarchaeota archaeon]|nr:hypothetical protein [Euryarchaeota archaeon]
MEKGWKSTLASQRARFIFWSPIILLLLWASIESTSYAHVDTKFSINSNENTADRYTSGNYNEPVPGGSNLDEEYSFMDWVEANGFLYSTTWELT